MNKQELLQAAKEISEICSKYEDDERCYECPFSYNGVGIYIFDEFSPTHWQIERLEREENGKE